MWTNDGKRTFIKKMWIKEIFINSYDLEGLVHFKIKNYKHQFLSGFGFIVEFLFLPKFIIFYMYKGLLLNMDKRDFL